MFSSVVMFFKYVLEVKDHRVYMEKTSALIQHSTKCSSSSTRGGSRQNLPQTTEESSGMGVVAGVPTPNGSEAASDRIIGALRASS